MTTGMVMVAAAVGMLIEPACVSGELALVVVLVWVGIERRCIYAVLSGKCVG